MLQLPAEPARDALREAMQRDWLMDDDALLASLLPLADIGETGRQSAHDLARRLVLALRAEQRGKAGVDALLNEYALSTEEGIALMCLAEALLRVPDAVTADALIRDKLQGGDWAAHLGRSHSSFVNASAWALLFTGKLVNYSDAQQAQLHSALQRAIGRLGQPVIRNAVRRAMGLMGEVFVLGRSIEAALERARTAEAQGYRYSYDMLGEGARTAAAAEQYFSEYSHAIECIGERHQGADPRAAAGISVKLSALHPRYQPEQRERVMNELVPRLRTLCQRAKHWNIGLTIDAEEAARLDLSLDVIAAICRDPALAGWDGFGLAVQAYQNRAPALIDWLAELAKASARRLNVRLVKGAYWDTEIKLAQLEGLAGYPVFTRKAATDVCYQACARKLLNHRPRLFPQFATHNAWSVAAILAMDADRAGYEFQRLHGMGGALYAQVMAEQNMPCRIYAPVGEHADLLAYLVRRLLENGANSSFVNNIVDEHVPVDSLIEDPVHVVRGWSAASHPRIPLPAGIYGPQRRNSAGLALCDTPVLQRLMAQIQRLPTFWAFAENAPARYRPADRRLPVGCWAADTPAQVQIKLTAATGAQTQAWPVSARVAFLRDLADRLEQDQAALLALCIAEAGKTLGDAIAELREAVDFCRYYATQAEATDGEPLGVVLCISPWNFPLAIFLGQITGALAAGNTVLAKPAEQSSLIALRALELMQDAGLPQNRVQLILGDGPSIGRQLLPDARIAGVQFTGSTATGRDLFRMLAARADAPVPLIAETGGLNAMIVDSSALPEQVVDDVIRSGFQSAGQRCSALRVLFLQADIADALIDMLRGAMDELRVGDPVRLDTDIGPLIDARAWETVRGQVDAMLRKPGVRLLHRSALGAAGTTGHFVPPTLLEMPTMGALKEECFGPVVHVVRYQANELETVIEQINAAGYGLTLGVHSRIAQRADQISSAAAVGNIYVNRDMIGAVVGVQPFGGRGLSGTGPKAGGPLYVPALTRQPAGMDTLEPQLLPGPTGERNLYRLQPRAAIHALYSPEDSQSHCLAALRAAQASGVKVCLHVPAAWRETLAEARQGTAGETVQIQTLTGDRLPKVQGGETWILAPGSRLIRPLLAKLADASDQPLPRVICSQPHDRLWTTLFNEQVISTNTAAAGGNAALMTLQA